MLLLAAALYVGNLACRPCHGEIVASYEKTPMARSSGSVDAVASAEFTAAGHQYRVAGKQLQFEGGSAALDYFIGSATLGRSFLFQRDGYLFQLPVTWYAQKGIWDASPGYERETEVRLSRAIDSSCMLCHSSMVRPVLGTQNRYGDPPFLQDGVGCERCHGPGSEHVQNPAAAPMVNPAKLAGEQRDSICAQCHLTGLARIVRAGRRFAEFRAGDALSDVATYYVRQSRDPRFTVTSHVEKLALSACKRASGEALWCGTCHDPHTNSDRSQEACLSCHAEAHHQAERCAGCHMPKSPPLDAGHSVMTDHSIPRTPRGRMEGPPASDLQAIIGVDDDRARGLAYAELGDPRAREYLLRASPADAEVALRLAVLESNPENAARLYQRVLATDPGNPAALVNLGTIEAQAGQTEAAAALWRRALQANPAIEQAALNLAQVVGAEEGRAVLRRYLEFNPGSQAVKAALAKIDAGQ